MKLIVKPTYGIGHFEIWGSGYYAGDPDVKASGNSITLSGTDASYQDQIRYYFDSKYSFKQSSTVNGVTFQQPSSGGNYVFVTADQLYEDDPLDGNVMKVPDTCTFNITLEDTSAGGSGGGSTGGSDGGSTGGGSTGGGSTGSSSKPQVTTPDTPFSNVYALSVDELKTLAKTLTTVSSDTDGNANSIDYTKYVSSLVQLPWILDGDMLGDKANVLVGYRSMGVEAHKVASTIIHLNLGSIEVANPADSVEGYKAEYSLRLPFNDSEVTLEAYQIEGETLTFKGVLDVVKGELTVNVYNGVDEPFKSVKYAVGRTLPVSMSSIQFGSASGVPNDVYSLSLQVKKPVLDYTGSGPLVKTTVDLGSYTGYVQMVDPEINGVMTELERAELETILERGFVL